MTLTIRDPALFFSTLSANLLRSPAPAYVFDQFVSKEIDFTRTEGDTISLNRYPKLGDQGLEQINRELNEQQTVGTADPVNITAESITVMLKEYAGPYSTPAQKVSPLGITEKTARRAQAKLIDTNDPESFFNSIGGMLLKDDLDRWHDRVLCRLFLTSPNSTNPANKANGSTLITDQISTFDLGTIKEKLQGSPRFTPTFNDGLYHAIVSPRMEKHLRMDDKFRAACQFGAYERLYRGELGVYEGFRFFSSNNIPTETVNSLTGHLGIFFGPDAVGYGEGLPPEVRKNKNDDYERFMYLIWLTYRGYAALDTRFIEVCRTFAP